MCELWSGLFLSTSTESQGFNETGLTPMDEPMGGRMKLDSRVSRHSSCAVVCL